MELGLGFALAEATVRESERVQCRRGEELAVVILEHLVVDSHVYSFIHSFSICKNKHYDVYRLHV